MYRLTNIVDDAGSLRPYGSPQEMRAWLSALSLDGFEAIRGYEGAPALPQDLAVGCHLLFYSDWVDFWRQDRAALLKKFGTQAAWEEYYAARTPDELVRKFREDMDYAESLGAKYAVFHVSDVSVQEGYDYRFLHTDEEVADASIELLNAAMRGREYHFELLLENLWWPGFTFTRPDIAERLFAGIEYKNTGILLDTGHLLNTCTSLRTGGEAVRYIHAMLDRHGELAKRIRGMHLHASLSGAYVEECLKTPKTAEGEFFRQFAEAYGHILTIDTHEPFLFDGVRELVERIAAEYLTYEFAEADPVKKAEKIRLQNQALGIAKNTL
ncbi:MAG: TIM barrel protein [Clostridia bacterium]|nr:TIM barrel protein [Clostridia bacterium]